MPKFRKKPIVIEAVRYLGKGNVEGHAPPHWLWEAFELGQATATDGGDPLILTTLNGDVPVAAGEWICRGVRGELYPCAADIFAETYEAVND